jgi:nicotinamide mononucleotide transporter
MPDGRARAWPGTHRTEPRLNDLLLGAHAALNAVLAPWFTLLGAPVTALEVLAFVLSLAMVGCNLRVNAWAWPLAIVSSLLYGLLFVHSRLYGEAGLQVLFVVLACWGWWQWLRGTAGDGSMLRVHRLSGRQRLQIVVATATAWPLFGLLLKHATDSDVPYLDALPTVASITGQLLLGRKLIENWAVWLFVNVVSVGLFAVKGLWLTVVLYSLFALLSVVGWVAWRRLETARG